MADFDPYRPPGEPANPYAPPEVDVGLRGQSHHPSFGAEPFSPGLVLSRAWTIYKERFWVIFGSVIGTVAVNLVLWAAVGGMMGALSGQNVAPEMSVVATIVAVIVCFVFGLSTMTGLLYTLTKVARGQPASVGDILRGGPFILRFLGATLLHQLAVLGVYAGCAIPVFLASTLAGQYSPGASLAVFVVGLIIMVVLVIAVSVRLYLYPFVIVDRDAGAVESLRGSYEITRGHVIELIGLGIVGSLIALAGFLAFFVGALFTYPLSIFLYPCTYVALTGTKTRGAGAKSRADIDFTN